MIKPLVDQLSEWGRYYPEVSLFVVLLLLGLLGYRQFRKLTNEIREKDLEIESIKGDIKKKDQEIVNLRHDQVIKLGEIFEAQRKAEMECEEAVKELSENLTKLRDEGKKTEKDIERLQALRDAACRTLFTTFIPAYERWLKRIYLEHMVIKSWGKYVENQAVKEITSWKRWIVVINSASTPDSVMVKFRSRYLYDIQQLLHEGVSPDIKEKVDLAVSELIQVQ